MRPNRPCSCVLASFHTLLQASRDFADLRALASSAGGRRSASGVRRIGEGCRMPPRPVGVQEGQSLRVWQRKALMEYLRGKREDFLAVATPGAGKTTFALRVA